MQPTLIPVQAGIPIAGQRHTSKSRDAFQESFAEQDSWFFTMEYIEGCNFLNAVWTKNASLGPHEMEFAVSHPSAIPTQTMECQEFSEPASKVSTSEQRFRLSGVIMPGCRRQFGRSPLGYPRSTKSASCIAT